MNEKLRSAEKIMTRTTNQDCTKGHGEHEMKCAWTNVWTNVWTMADMHVSTADINVTRFKRSAACHHFGHVLTAAVLSEQDEVNRPSCQLW